MPKTDKKLLIFFWSIRKSKHQINGEKGLEDLTNIIINQIKNSHGNI